MKLEQLMEFVTKVLSLHDNSTIKRFHLCCIYAIPDNVTCDESTELVNLMVNRNVEESNICGDGADYDPSDPEDDMRKLNLRCLTLQNLIIEDCDDLSQISIHGTSLTFLMIKSGTGLGFMLASVDDHHAEVDTTIRHDDDNIKEYAIEVRCLNKLLKGLVHTKSLTLSADAFQGKASEEIPNMFKDVSSFRSLRYFKLTNWHTSSCIPALAKLFDRFPCMETPVLEKTKEYCQSSTKEEEWGNQFMTQGMFMKLKSVEIKGIEGSGDELKFLEFTLKIALMLENVIMTPTRELSRDGLERLKEFNKKIQHLPRASAANVTIVVKLS
ncbi:hypothetical protein FRX31_017785 [Thalictrum thalictroides]|uniref:FBD domain-containing protein n=1 Tax=Thalictrum thalictroides TaxID=46969 RepID=A0A7J6W854_THATH|nr:hypothetical protein FRX31_017785 [Thalictrum thalictroides]